MVSEAKGVAVVREAKRLVREAKRIQLAALHTARNTRGSAGCSSGFLRICIELALCRLSGRPSFDGKPKITLGLPGR